MIYQKLGTSTVWEKIDALYNGGKPYIAEFASLVFEAYDKEDEIAIRIIDNTAKALAEPLETAKKRYKTGNIAIASGGLFQHYHEIMKERISRYTKIKLETCDLAPICGACKNACTIASVKTSDLFYENFKKSIGEKRT